MKSQGLARIFFRYDNKLQHLNLGQIITILIRKGYIELDGKKDFRFYELKKLTLEPFDECFIKKEDHD